MVQNEALSAYETDGAAEPDDETAIRCYRWPDKVSYRTADQASLALRDIFLERAQRRGEPALNLGVYHCFDPSGTVPEHYHHGRLPIRAGTMLHPEERGPGRAVRGAIRRPGGRSSPGLPRRRR